MLVLQKHPSRWIHESCSASIARVHRFLMMTRLGTTLFHSATVHHDLNYGPQTLRHPSKSDKSDRCKTINKKIFETIKLHIFLDYFRSWFPIVTITFSRDKWFPKLIPTSELFDFTSLFALVFKLQLRKHVRL